MDRGPIALAEKVIALLEEGRFTATYKYAVLLALIDLSLELTSRTGDAPDMLTTRQLAEKVVEQYWSHTEPYVHQTDPGVLLQNAARPGVQARILHVLEHDDTIGRALSGAFSSNDAGWLRSTAPRELKGIVELRNPAAHSEAVGRERVEAVRALVLGIGCEGVLVRLAKVKG